MTGSQAAKLMPRDYREFELIFRKNEGTSGLSGASVTVVMVLHTWAFKYREQRKPQVEPLQEIFTNKKLAENCG